MLLVRFPRLQRHRSLSDRAAGPGWRPKDERFGPTLAHEKLMDAALAWDFVIDSASERQ